MILLPEICYWPLEEVQEPRRVVGSLQLGRGQRQRVGRGHRHLIERTVHHALPRLSKVDVLFRASSSNLRSSIDEGASCSSERVKLRTVGSDTLRSRLGGWSAHIFQRQPSTPSAR